MKKRNKEQCEKEDVGRLRCTDRRMTDNGELREITCHFVRPKGRLNYRRGQI